MSKFLLRWVASSLLNANTRRKCVALATMLCVAFSPSVALAEQASIPEQSVQSERHKYVLNQDWQYHLGDVSDAKPYRKGYKEDSNWQSVTLPHTYKLTSVNLDNSTDDKTQQTFHRDVSWYRKSVDVTAEKGQRIYLEFEGAHQKTAVWVNGQFVGEHATSAYTPFHFDITEFVKPGKKNQLALRLDNRRDDDIPPDGAKRDFVLFGGLYRDVYLVVTNPLHFSFPWQDKFSGISITTPTVSERDATISVRSQVINASKQAQNFELRTYVADAENRVVLSMHKTVQVAAKQNAVFKQTGGIVENVHLWSIEQPYLYRVVSQVVQDGQVIDSVENPLGLRWFDFRLGEGFLLNGKPVELIGANRHQHFAYIGDAVPNNLHRSDAIKFKQAGMNVVRLAHYPHDDAFLKACDELGILIMEETPSWIEFGSPLFMQRMEDATRIMIRNHRNNPSVVGWAGGINHRGAVRRLHYAAKEEDPTRVTMNNGTLWTGEQHSGVTDLYAVMDYRGAVRPDHDLLFAMEHSGSKDTMKLQEIVSRYKADPNLIGLASWAAHDGHSFNEKRDEEYENLSTWRASSWDIFRLPKPSFYWYKSELTEAPMVHIAGEGAHQPGKVNIFTNTDSVIAYLDGERLGEFTAQRTDKNAALKSPSIWLPLDWQRGELWVQGMRDGKVVAEHKRVKGGEPTQLSLSIDTTGFDGAADGSSILMAYASIQDQHGNLVDAKTPLVQFGIDGPAQIVGDAEIGANPVHWRHGVAPIMLRVGATPGVITLTASSKGLQSSSATITTQAWQGAELTALQPPLLLPVRAMVDLGNAQQHVQDEWQAWIGESASEQLSVTPENAPPLTFSITATAQAKWSHTWGVPGDLSFMIEDGIEVPATESLSLTIKGLPKGQYTIKTWHHVLKGQREEAPALAFSLKASDAKSPQNYWPTYGRKIVVSDAGGGDRGDGGSNQGAEGFALHSFRVPASGEVQLTIRSQSSQGVIRLNGFDLEQH